MFRRDAPLRRLPKGPASGWSYRLFFREAGNAFPAGAFTTGGEFNVGPGRRDDREDVNRAVWQGTRRRIDQSAIGAKDPGDHRTQTARAMMHSFTEAGRACQDPYGPPSGRGHPAPSHVPHIETARAERRFRENGSGFV